MHTYIHTYIRTYIHDRKDWERNQGTLTVSIFSGMEFPTLNALKYALEEAEDLPDKRICHLVRDFFDLPILPEGPRKCNLIKTFIEAKE